MTKETGYRSAKMDAHNLASEANIYRMVAQLIARGKAYTGVRKLMILKQNVTLVLLPAPSFSFLTTFFLTMQSNSRCWPRVPRKQMIFGLFTVQ